MFGKIVVMKCPDCGTVVKGKSGLFSKSFACSNCKRMINPATDSLEVVTCQACGNSVMYDTRKGVEKICPECGNSLENYAFKTVKVNCPGCHIPQQIRYDEKFYTCPLCTTTFDAERERKKLEIENTSTATVITIPTDNTDIICQHETTVFAYASQLVVPEGYTALILYNGRCLAPSLPGNYLLSDTLNTQEEILKQAVLDPMKQVSVQVFFVKNKIEGSIGWGDAPSIVQDDEGNEIGKLILGGSVSLKISDAKRFAEFAGYKRVTRQDILPLGGTTELLSFIRNYCISSATAVLLGAARQSGKTPNYHVVVNNKDIYVEEIRRVLNYKLEELGIQAVILSIENAVFSDSAQVEEEKKKVKNMEINKEEILYLVENLFDWKSPELKIHKKGDLTVDATIVMGGQIKLRVKNENQLFERNEVKKWSKTGILKEQVHAFTYQLVQNASMNVLNDVLQPMINDTDADIRDMTVYYQYLRRSIQSELNVFFDNYGLVIEQFSMNELKRTNGYGLEKLMEIEKHSVDAKARKSNAEIEQDVYAFEKKFFVERKQIDSNANIALDNISLNEEMAFSKNDQVRVGLTVDKINAGAYIQQQKDKAAYETEMNEHNLEHKKYEYDQQWAHNQKMTQYGYGSDYKQAEHNQAMMEMKHETEMDAALHYKNQQEIENRAAELRTKWENDSRLQRDNLRHQIEMAEEKWKFEKGQIVGQHELNNDLEESDAQKERRINEILRKVAESDLELREKKDMYTRMLNNLEKSDAFTFWKEEESAKLEFAYESAHLKNILTQEEMDYLDKMKEKSVMRDESIKNADFIRSMQQFQAITELEMRCLQLENEKENRQADLEHELRLRDKEIEILKLQLDAEGKAGDRSVDMYRMQTDADTARIKAEQEYRYRFEAQERAARERQERETLEREERESKRADELLSQMLSIQKVLGEIDLMNTRTKIQEDADVKKTEAKAWADASVASANANGRQQSAMVNQMSADIKALMEDMKRIAERMDSAVNKMKKENNKKYKETNDSSAKYTSRPIYPNSYL